MTRQFLVLSLPRSRTAWLTHLLRTGGLFRVGHDLSVHCATIADFLAGYDGPGHVGTVDTGAVAGWRLIRHLMPQLRVVTLHRPVGEVVASFCRLDIEPDVALLEERSAMLEACAKAPGVESVASADLDDPLCCRWLYETLLEVDLDQGWYDEVASMRIEIDMAKRARLVWENRERLASLATEVAALTAGLPATERGWMI